MTGRGGHEKGLLGAGLLGSLGAAAGGTHGYFEGADIDALQNERRRNQMRQELLP